LLILALFETPFDGGFVFIDKEFSLCYTPDRYSKEWKLTLKFKKRFFMSFSPTYLASSGPEEKYKAGKWHAFIMGILFIIVIVGYLLLYYLK